MSKHYKSLHAMEALVHKGRYISFGVGAFFNLSTSGHEKLRSLIPYKTCGWGVCKKPARRWTYKARYPSYIGHFCHEHAMWRCKEWNGFDIFYDKEHKDAWKRHAKEHRNGKCVPSKELTRSRKEQSNE